MEKNIYKNTFDANMMPETTNVFDPDQHVNLLVHFTGIVVTYNEASRLRECLHSLAFCEQIIVMDLGSTDASVGIAKECNAEIIFHERVQIVEQIRAEAITHARNDWVIFIDPDEIFPKNYDSLCFLITNASELGGISIPLQYYFMGRKLTSTIWGTPKHKLRVVHKERVFLDEEIHKMISVNLNFLEAKIDLDGENYIKHYWADSYRKLIAKHLRYLTVEGKTRFEKGERFSLRKSIKSTLMALWNNLIDFQGWRGGWHGWFLSFFYTWYISMGFMSVLIHEIANRSRK